MSSVDLFKQFENSPMGSELPWTAVLASLPFNQDGLLPAIAQQYDSKEVLMLAWMNHEALQETILTKRVCYWSRSRQRLWRKGESSGQIQKLVSLHLDCDGDALLLWVDQTGPACHTGRRSCFYYDLEQTSLKISNDPLIDPATLYKTETV